MALNHRIQVDFFILPVIADRGRAHTCALNLDHILVCGVENDEDELHGWAFEQFFALPRRFVAQFLEQGR